MFRGASRRGLGPRLLRSSPGVTGHAHRHTSQRLDFVARFVVGVFMVLPLQLTMVSATLAQPSLSLEMDGKQQGVFTSLAQARDGPDTVTLEQGWVSFALLDAWSPGLTTDGTLQAGRHEFGGGCIGRRLEVVQSLATGQRSRVRSWTLIDACPLWCQIETQEDGKIIVTSLTLRVKGVGVVQ